MENKLSRRDFLKIAGIGLGAVAFGDLLSACSKKEGVFGEPTCTDPKHVVVLNEGDYIYVGSYKFGLYKYKRVGEEDYAYFELIEGGKRVEFEWDSIYYQNQGAGIVLGPGLPAIKVGGLLRFEPDPEAFWGFRRIMYRCDRKTFAFWTTEEIKNQLLSYSTPIPKPTSSPTATRIPSAIFP